LRVTRRTVPIIFSMMLVQASERHNSGGRPSLPRCGNAGDGSLMIHVGNLRSKIMNPCREE
jgi:hypothetical protein